MKSILKPVTSPNILAARLVLVVGAALIASGAALAQGTIKIGFHAALTGPAAADGNGGLAAAKIAVEDFNKAGGLNGRKVELLTFDDQGKPDQAVPVANRMLGEGVKAVISTGFSGPSKAAAPVFQKAKVPYIAAIAFAPEITRNGNYVFRTSSVGEVQGLAGAKVVADMVKKKRVVMLTVKNDFGKTLSDGFKGGAVKFGLNIVKEYEYTMADRQFGPVIASIKADNPEVIYAIGQFFSVGPFMSQLRAAGVTAQVVGPEAMSSQKFIDIAGPAAEGTIITNVIDWSSKAPQITQFLAEYERVQKDKAEAAATSTYVAATVLLEAIKTAKSDDSDKIRDALEKTNMMTAAGKISFNGLHEVRKSFPVSIVKNGNWEGHGMIDDAVLLAPPEK